MSRDHAAARIWTGSAGLAIALLVSGLVYAIAARFTPAHACTPGTPGCVSVSTSAAGAPGSPAPSKPGHSGGGGKWKPDPCAKYPGEYYTLCKRSKGTNCLSMYDQYFGTMPLDQLNTLLAANGCPAVPVGAAPAPTPGQLARRAADSVRLPSPSAGRYPAGTLGDGRPYTVVGAYTWFWTDAAAWHSYTATAQAGGNWASVTVAPTSLSFTPGDGNAVVSCAGPGSVWASGVDGPWDASPSGCQYRYPHSSIHEPNQEVTATYTITWQLTWTGSGNTSGTLTARTTSSTSTFAVAEVESVVTG